MGSAGAPLIIRRVWRSELLLLALFAITVPASIVLSQLMPSSVIKGDLMTLFGYRVLLSLPLFWLVPLFFGSLAAYRMFDTQYLMDDRGVQARMGILSFSQEIQRIRYEDVRSLEIKQTILDRLLGIGRVLIGTAGTGDVEISIRGIAAPGEVLEMIQRERDFRQMTEESNASEAERVVVDRDRAASAG